MSSSTVTALAFPFSAETPSVVSGVSFCRAACDERSLLWLRVVAESAWDAESPTSRRLLPLLPPRSCAEPPQLGATGLGLTTGVGSGAGWLRGGAAERELVGWRGASFDLGLRWLACPVVLS